MPRILFALLVALTTLAMPAAAQPSPEPMMTEMPVAAMYCDSDPGPFNPGGGRGYSLEDMKARFGCVPAEDVSLTFVLVDDEFDFEHPDKNDPDVTAESWYQRCTIDAEGGCTVNAPNGFEFLLGVNLHTGTVRPGYEPVKMLPTTQNVTEFAGYGLIFVPSDGATVSDDPAENQTLALQLTTDGEPVEGLTSWVYGDDEPTYLASNDGGWVSDAVEAGDEIVISGVDIELDSSADFTCAVDGDAGVEVEVHLHEGDLHITVPETQADIRCDLAVAP